MRYLFLGLFLLTSCVHLYDSWRDDPRRAKTKPFLLLFLVLFYLASTKDYVGVLLAALITSWLGDVLLIPNGHGWFTAGGISFLCSHIFFILTYTRHIAVDRVPWVLIVVAAVLYFGISFLIIKAVTPTTPKPMLVPMYLYLIANSTMNIFALIQLFCNRNGAAWTAYIGALLFFISDCTLFLVRYYKNKDLIFKKHFIVMLTYLAGEFMIVLGILGLQ